MRSERSWKQILFNIFLAVIFLGFLALAAVRTADLYYKAGWMVAHLPPPGKVCTELFCLRTDTSKPEWKFLQIHFAYCPEHLPSGFQGRGGRSVGVLIYLSVFMILFTFLSVPILGALFKITAWPVLVPLKLSGKLPPGQLVPFARFFGHAESGPGEWLEMAGMWAGALVAIVALILYCWW